MARRLVPKRRGTSVNLDTAPLQINIIGGMPGFEEQDFRFTMINDSGQPRRLRVLGGLPSYEDGTHVLQGECMTAEERAEHNAKTNAAIFGGSNNHQLTTAAPTPTKDQS